MNTGMIIAIVVIALIAIGVAAWALFERNRTRNLRTKFGPEYENVLDHEKNTRKAETVLEEREKRVASYRIRSLNQEERARFGDEWKAVQEHFVDDPRGAMAQADKLINEAMRARGYPMSDFEQQAADLSVDYSEVVQNYRAGHEIARRDSQGKATTEELRRAMQYYRKLFENILGAEALQNQEVRH